MLRSILLFFTKSGTNLAESLVLSRTPPALTRKVWSGVSGRVCHPGHYIDAAGIYPAHSLQSWYFLFCQYTSFVSSSIKYNRSLPVSREPLRPVNSYIYLYQTEHLRKCKCHDCNQQDTYRILRFFYLYIQNKKQSHDNHCNMYHDQEIESAISSHQIKDGRMIAMDVIGSPW